METMKLIDYYNDTEKEVNIEDIGPAGAGFNAPRKVRVNGILGFKKQSINCSTFDSFEYLICQLGKMLDIKVADTYFFDDGSIFSKSIYEEGEEFITGDKYLECIDVSEDEKKKYIEEKNKFDETLEKETVNGREERVAKTKEEIKTVIDQYITRIDRLNVDNRDEIVKDYIRMCFLDTLTGNKDRVSGNYGLIKRGNNYSFAPLFDSSTIAYKDMKNDCNYVQLNHYLIDRNNLYNYLVSNYYECLSDIFDKDRKQVIDKMKSLLDKVFPNEDDKKNKEWFNNEVIGHLDYYLNGVNSLFLEDENNKKKETIDNTNNYSLY